MKQFILIDVIIVLMRIMAVSIRIGIHNEIEKSLTKNGHDLIVHTILIFCSYEVHFHKLHIEQEAQSSIYKQFPQYFIPPRLNWEFPKCIEKIDDELSYYSHLLNMDILQPQLMIRKLNPTTQTYYFEKYQ